MNRVSSAGSEALVGLLLMTSRGIVALGCGIIYARSLGAEGRGKISLVITTAGLIGLAVHSIAVPSLVRARLSGKWADGQLRAQALLVAGLGAAPLAVAATIIIAFGTSGAPADGLLLLTLLLAMATSLVYVAQGLGEGRWAGGWGAVGAASAGAATVALSLLHRLTPRSAVFGFCLVYLVPLLALLARGIRWPRARSDLRQQASTAASAVLVLLLWRSDIYIVAGLLSTRQLGIYAAGVAVAETTQVAVTGLRAALTPRLQPLGSEDLPVALFARLNQLALLLLILTGIGLATFGRRLFEGVYGPDFAQGAIVALVLLPGMWGFITVSTYLETLQISEEGRFLVLVVSGALVANVVMNLALARTFGIILPAASSSLCYLGLGCLTLRRASRLGGVPASNLLWPKSSDRRR